MQPIYDITKSYLYNLENGPFFSGTIPPRPPFGWKDFLGFKIASRIGVPAGPLLNSNWVGLAADLGYDVLTYKTIRSYEHQSHPLPNIALVDIQGQLNPHKLPGSVKRRLNPPKNLQEVAMTNSFGNPSRPPEYLRKDIKRALEKLHPGQVLIVSIFGTSTDEYLFAARLAKECSAPIIEANFSCPNVASKEGSLFSNPQEVESLSRQIVQEIGTIPLVIKLGMICDPALLKQVLVAAARGGARAVCGINTISLSVSPPLGKNREKCGICGFPILNAALQFTREAKRIIDKEKLDLELMTTGGVAKPEHFQQMFDAGASIAMTATAMMWDPCLASNFHKGCRRHA